MDSADYDEFGNYIGPDLSSSDSEIDEPSTTRYSPIESDDDLEPNATNRIGPGMDVDDEPGGQIVLHEDKKYYPTAAEVYGDDVEVLVQDEDTQPITEPIIKPTKVKAFQVTEQDLPPTFYQKQFLVDLLGHPELVRNVTLAGHLHHGKTALMDLLVEETHSRDRDNYNLSRYTDTHFLEMDRLISIKASPMSLVLPTSKGKSYALNIMDTPGHVDFIDEFVAASRLGDGIVLVVDAVEGVMVNTERIIQFALQEQLPLTLVINKVDRLIVELKLPPTDAYHKLKHTIVRVNALLRAHPGWTDRYYLSPERGNVCFASALGGWCFSLSSFARMYTDLWDVAIPVADLAARLWGDIYYHPEHRTFHRKSNRGQLERSFVHFILAPLYKLYSHVLGQAADLPHTLATLGVHLKPRQLTLDPKDLLHLVLRQFFGSAATALVEMVVTHVPSPVDGAARLVERFYPGPMDGPHAEAMLRCDPAGPLMVQVAKLYPDERAENFYALGRILSGTVTTAQTVRVLGESYSPLDEEDMAVQSVTGLWIYESRYKIEVASLGAGSWVLLGGVDTTITTSATVTDQPTAGPDVDVYTFRPLRFPAAAVFKVAIEPVQPVQHPRLLDGLRKISKSYPLLTTKVEESGEHIVLGSGEIYMDCVLHDLRKLYAEIDINVADPSVRFCETVVETSSIKCHAETPNHKNKLSMVSEPLERKVCEDIEARRVSIEWPARQLGQYMERQHQWDILAARSIWAFGPDNHGPNILLDDTLPSEVDKTLLRSVRDSVRQGFQWATREGPLCDETIRGVKFKILGADLAPEALYRGGGQVIPTARRVCYSSFLMATPRLMEPVYYVEVQAPADCVASVYTVLARRRGHVTQDLPNPGSPLYTVKAYLPVIDSFGFETDLRAHTQGQAFCQQVFDHWEVVPGDPLDKGLVIRPLEVSGAPLLARDFMLKTRRRKGLSEDVSIGKYFDDPMLLELAQNL
ncbi:116 kda U5 small nuclear ribonucleo protein-like protein component [Dimargaris cristalligena]|uniref:116 kDa U5 small nuclear ribonucleo protein-like protein component n=1 Tax=Dimargaris cristalligena TaxID=215637 RepID=A0A4P9ZYW6_9FUNG|nr:116 kda U5 small nuclear ribonucleo protein-like protein component [Dimargaris cristalligena]|eukprot:RKP37980.1 116 kda U5 small nuclear ribonucleo protein-like protein component [Dimargaris cristalligena]